MLKPIFAVILYKVHETICLFYHFILVGGLMNVTAPMLNVAGHLFFCIVCKGAFELLDNYLGLLIQSLAAGGHHHLLSEQLHQLLL